ncbi:MAG: flavodoxin family protein [Bacillota bacterium]
MLIIALNGSPNPDGNTAHLLELALQAVKREGARGELVHVAAVLDSQKDPFCRACASPCPGRCYRNSELETVFSRLRRADGIIMGSPVYFGTISAQLKAFWDKSRKLRAEHALLNTVGTAVTVGAARFGGQETTLKALHDIMLVQGMILVGDGHHSADAGHQGTCAQRPADTDLNAAGRVEIAARRVVEVSGATASLRQSMAP